MPLSTLPGQLRTFCYLNLLLGTEACAILGGMNFVDDCSEPRRKPA